MTHPQNTPPQNTPPQNTPPQNTPPQSTPPQSTPPQNAPLKWWETAVIYQIYPRSFQDSNGDGIGDLGGVIKRLDYIAKLGVDALWLSPFYKSPQKDFGYDVADYCAINPEYGTLEDFARLCQKAHDLGLKVMVDLVPAHCSDQHPWFQESRQNRNNPKADWFHWAEPLEDGSAPTNWLSFFGGRAWSWEPRRQQYYLHNFLPSQPNLNHANPNVRDALCQAMQFWLAQGVDGFRLDAVHTVNASTPPYQNNAPNPHFKPSLEADARPQTQQPFFRQLHDTAQLNQPPIQGLIEDFRKTAENHNENHHKDIFLMGELHGHDPIKASQVFTQKNRLHATYNFSLLAWKGLDIDAIKDAITNAAHAFNDSARLTFAFSNHDVPRVATRQAKPLGLDPISDAQQDDLQILLLKLELCLIGSTCIYQGEELGLGDATDIPIDKLQDPWGREFAPAFLGRDTCRTPLVWDQNQPHCGFSNATETWLPISEKHKHRTANTQVSQPDSVYNRLAAFLAWRKTQPALTQANHIGTIKGAAHEIIFDRMAQTQRLRCHFDFETLNASFKEI